MRENKQKSKDPRFAPRLGHLFKKTIPYKLYMTQSNIGIILSLSLIVEWSMDNFKLNRQGQGFDSCPAMWFIKNALFFILLTIQSSRNKKWNKNCRWHFREGLREKKKNQITKKLSSALWKKVLLFFVQESFDKKKHFFAECKKMLMDEWQLCYFCLLMSGPVDKMDFNNRNGIG